MDGPARPMERRPARPLMPTRHRVVIATLIGGVLGALCATEGLSKPWSAACASTVAIVDWFGLRWAERLGLPRAKKTRALLPEQGRPRAKRIDRWASVAFYGAVASAMAFVAIVDRWRPPGEAALAVGLMAVVGNLGLGVVVWAFHVDDTSST